MQRTHTGSLTVPSVSASPYENWLIDSVGRVVMVQIGEASGCPYTFLIGLSHLSVLLQEGVM